MINLSVMNNSRVGLMSSTKSFILIFTGITFISITILNLFFDIPDAISSNLLERSLVNNVTNLQTDNGVKDAVTIPLDPGSTKPLPQESSHQEKQIGVLVSTQKSTFLPAAVRDGYIPDRIVIPAIHLDAPIVESIYSKVELRDQWFEQWKVPDEFAVGWQVNSAPLGIPGNSVIGGHHNEYGKVFGHLVELEMGDIIYVYSGNENFAYRVVDKQLLKEKDVSIDIKKANAEWISKTNDERLTLVTCWPKRSNTHRVIIVAEPIIIGTAASGK